MLGILEKAQDAQGWHKKRITTKHNKGVLENESSETHNQDLFERFAHGRHDAVRRAEVLKRDLGGRRIGCYYNGDEHR